MTVLGIDTATRRVAAGIHRDGEAVADHSAEVEGGASEVLVDLVGRVLADAETALEALDGVAVGIGPGSFTGTRVGVGFARGLALARDHALAGVSTLESLAWNTRAPRVASCVDARKGEVYLAVFVREGGRLVRIVPETSLEPSHAAAELERRLEPADVVVGDAIEVHPDVFARLTERGVSWERPGARGPLGSAVAAAGLTRLRRGAEVDLAPLYLGSSGVR